MLNRKDIDLLRVEIADRTSTPKRSNNFAKLFKSKQRRRTILASLPWFLQDLSTYGIGIFTPVIIAAAFGAKAGGADVASIIHDDLIGAKGTALIDIGFLVGISVAIYLADRWGRIPLQITGFIGCAAGLFFALIGRSGGDGNLPSIVVGFVIFQFMTNLGPNSRTYLIAGEVFPTKYRGIGAGFAAASGKVGAVLTAFCFPLLMASIGTERLLVLLLITSLLGALATWLFRVETKGLDLESL